VRTGFCLLIGNFEREISGQAEPKPYAYDPYYNDCYDGNDDGEGGEAEATIMISRKCIRTSSR
jgi:hypothetical protein